MDDREFFDKLAPVWDENEIMSTSERVEYILDYMDLRAGQSVLDLGTGTGVLLPYIAKRVGNNGKIVGVDYSKEMLARAYKKFKGLSPSPELLNLDFERENIPGEYDRIILYCVYPHLHNPEETLKWLIKVNLRENGKLFIAFPCVEDFINNIHKERHSESDLLPSAKDLASHLKTIGFDAEDLSADYVVSLCNFKS